MKLVANGKRPNGHAVSNGHIPNGSVAGETKASIHSNLKTKLIDSDDVSQPSQDLICLLLIALRRVIDGVVVGVLDSQSRGMGFESLVSPLTCLTIAYCQFI